MSSAPGASSQLPEAFICAASEGAVEVTTGRLMVGLGGGGGGALGVVGGRATAAPPPMVRPSSAVPALPSDLAVAAAVAVAITNGPRTARHRGSRRRRSAVSRPAGGVWLWWMIPLSEAGFTRPWCRTVFEAAVPSCGGGCGKSRHQRRGAGRHQQACGQGGTPPGSGQYAPRLAHCRVPFRGSRTGGKTSRAGGIRQSRRQIRVD